MQKDTTKPCEPLQYKFDPLAYLEQITKDMEAGATHKVQHSYGTLVIIMTEEQRRMLAKFGDITLIDGTYKTVNGDCR